MILLATSELRALDVARRRLRSRSSAPIPSPCRFPTGKGYHVKVDLATSLVARGNIIAAQKQRRIDPGRLGA